MEQNHVGKSDAVLSCGNQFNSVVNRFPNWRHSLQNFKSWTKSFWIFIHYRQLFRLMKRFQFTRRRWIYSSCRQNMEKLRRENSLRWRERIITPFVSHEMLRWKVLKNWYIEIHRLPSPQHSFRESWMELIPYLLTHKIYNILYFVCSIYTFFQNSKNWAISY